MRELAVAITIAGTLIAAAIYFEPPTEGRYVLTANGMRLNTVTGQVMACGTTRGECYEYFWAGDYELEKPKPKAAP